MILTTTANRLRKSLANTSLRIQILVLCLLIAILATVLIAGFSYVRAAQIIQSNAYQQTDQLVYQSASYFDLTWQKILAEVNSLAADSTIRHVVIEHGVLRPQDQATAQGDIATLFESVRRRNPAIANIYLYTPGGDYYEFVESPKTTFPKTEMYTEVQGKQLNSWLTPRADEIFTTQGRVIPLVVRFDFENTGNFSYLVVNLGEKQMLDYLQGLHAGTDNQLVILTDSNVPAVQSQTAYPSLFDNAALAQHFTDPQNHFDDIYSNSQTSTDLFIDYATMKANGWKVVSVQSQQALVSGLSGIQQFTILVSIITILVAALLSGLLANSITRPVSSLTKITASLAAGDFSQRLTADEPVHDTVSTAGSKEIQALTDSFNKMSRELAILYSTLEKRVEERTVQLAEARLRAEQANRAKSIFLSNMSHELRTPLNVIIGYTSSMLERPQMYNNIPLPGIYREDVELIKENGHYLVGLISDILDLSKIEAGRLELQLAPLNVVDIFKGVIATTVGLVKDKAVQIRPDYPAQLPTVQADAMRVRQIILNLMSNAAKFTERGSITLHAHVDGEQVIISVIDTGIGIPEKALLYIFDRFRQAEQDTNKRYGGTGLGLDISKQLCQMLGGDLTVESVVGQGTTFTFSLPVIVGAVQLPTQPTEILSLSRVLTSTDGDIVDMHSVLLVEDNITVRNMLRGTLEAAGYLISEAGDSASALEMALVMLPDVIVIDLPDGEQLTEQLKANPETKAIPLIVYSPKNPVNSDQILDAVQKVLVTTPTQ